MRLLAGGVAPTIEALIAGRAIAGVGAAGIFVSCLSIIADVTTLEDRPKLFGSFGGVFGLSSVIGREFRTQVPLRECADL